MNLTMVVQSDSNEDSQGRQLRVSKKLSKAISYNPLRSRIQKPRPNLPAIPKRPNLSSVPARKPVESSQNKNDSNTTVLKTNETLQNEEKTENTVLNTAETSQKFDTINDAAPSTGEAPQNVEEENNILLKTNSILEEKAGDNILLLNTNETFEDGDTNVTISVEEVIKKKDSKNTSVLHTEESLHEDNQNVTELSVDAFLKNGDYTNTEDLVTEEIIKEKENAVLTVTVDEVLLEKNNRNQAVLNTESLPKPPEQEKADVNVPSGAIDRSSKYPHLTSILSKKRSEPRKEVRQKRRKQFRHVVAPERSKMTMADLIYWNPAKKEEESTKSTTNTNEVPIPINDEEECVDGDVGETNICDSVPKLVISEDGQINIDQTSLIVSRNISQPLTTQVIGKDEATYSSFRKRPLTKHWSPKDTTIFYKALSLVGTDFGLMEKIFPHRTRRELKQKFKREEKFNIDLINRAMYESQLTFDANTLDDLIEHLNNISDGANSENGDDFEAPVKGKKKSNKKQKTAKKTKSADAEFCDSATESLPDNVVSKREVSSRRQRKTKKLPEDFVDVDDIENAVELASSETNSDAESKRENNKKRRKTKAVPDDFSTGLLEELIEITAEETNNDELQPTVSKDIENNETDNEQKQMMNKTDIEQLIMMTDNEQERMINETDSEQLILTTDNEQERVMNETDMEQLIMMTDNEQKQMMNKTDSERLIMKTDNKQERMMNETDSELIMTTDNEQEAVEICIPTEYIEDIGSVTDSTTLLSNVMAYEVVTSQSPMSRRKAQNHKSLKKNQTLLPLVLSSTNYTPS